MMSLECGVLSVESGVVVSAPQVDLKIAEGNAENFTLHTPHEITSCAISADMLQCYVQIRKNLRG